MGRHHAEVRRRYWHGCEGKMIAPLFIWILLIINFVIGAGLCKAFRIEKRFIHDMSFVCIVPLVGAVGTICFAQIFSLFLTMKQAGILFVITLVIGSCFYSREYIVECFRTISKSKVIVFCIVAVPLVLSVPAILQGELLSIQRDNNDIIYYLSTMEWYQDHTILDAITVDPRYPWIELVDIMMNRNKTRLGVDFFGALWTGLFGLEPHQTFSPISVLFVVLLSLAAYGLAGFGLKMSEKCCGYVLVLVGFCSVQFHLLYMQYAPQILGGACLLAFATFLIKLILEEEEKLLLFTSFCLSGVLSVYCEYALHILLLTAVVAAAAIIIKKSLKPCLTAVKTGLLSVACNPVGFFLAIRMNYSIFTRVAENTFNNIDPWSGREISFSQACKFILGISETSTIKDFLSRVFRNNNEIIEVLSNMYGIIIPVLFVAVILLIITTIIKCNDNRKYMWTGMYAALLLIALYFKLKQFTYGEYKQLLMLSPFSIIMIVYCFESQRYNNKIIENIVFVGNKALVIILFVLNSFQIYRDVRSWFVYYNKELVDFDAAVSALVPPNEAVGLPLKDPALMHGALYALRNHAIVIRENNNYLAEFISDEETIYDIYPQGNSYDIINNFEFEMLWHDSRYQLIKTVESYKIDFVSGFYNLETHESIPFRWTNGDAEQVVKISNAAREDNSYLVSFQAGDAPGGIKKVIHVLLNGEEIGFGETGAVIQTNKFTIPARKNVELAITTDQPATLIDTGDTRHFGFHISHFSVNQE
ncbi:MAG: hypothetical protein LBL45_12990 [Treponema sp.]|jgi:hypothetical protein|nr:hypothetical protein [Treponema sp.]